MEREFEDLGYYVTASVHDTKLSVEFIVAGGMYEEIEFHGFIKWDGCSNWHVEGNHYQFHFCEPQDARNFAELICRLYDWAAELMPDSELIRSKVKGKY